MHRTVVERRAIHMGFGDFPKNSRYKKGTISYIQENGGCRRKLFRHTTIKEGRYDDP